MVYTAPQGTELLRRIGAGSTFDVALVRDAGTSLVPLVCKRLTSRMLREPAGHAALAREAKVLSLARHPVLPSLVRAGSDGHGPFVLETYVAGVSLRGLIERRRTLGKPVPPRLVGHIAQASIEALTELHELADDAGPLEIAHGDLGPDHVILGPFGEVRFIDLGAARFRGADEDPATSDRGTLPFVAPEVARGEAAPSAAGDVYALAATLLHLATGGPICSARGEAAMLVEIGERGVDVGLLERAEAFSPLERAALRAALVPDPSARVSEARALLSAFTTKAERPPV